MPDTASPMLTVQEVAELMGVHENTVYRWIRDDGLPARRAGKLWRIRREDLETWTEPTETTR
jgi:excisionase family DNA binding protein